MKMIFKRLLAALLVLALLAPQFASAQDAGIAISAKNVAAQAKAAAATNANRLNAPGVLGNGYMQLSSRVNWPLANVSGQPTTTYRIRYVLPKGGRNIRLVYFGGYGTNGTATECLTPATGSFSFSAGLEYPLGVTRQAAVNGVVKPTISSCQFMVTDPIAAIVPPGGTIWVRSTAYQAGSTVWPGSAVTLSLAGNNGQDGDGTGYRVLNATNASPIVISGSGRHNLSTGVSVTVTGCTGNTAANGTWTVTNVSTTSFSLNGSTGNGTFAGGCNVIGADFSTDLAGQMTTSGGGVAFAPVAIVGDPYDATASRAWVAILLDSIARGSGETLTDGGNGWISRGLGGSFTPVIPWINIAIPGLTSAQFADAANLPLQSEKRRRLALSAPYVINNGGTNDLTAGATWQQIAGYNLSIATDAKAQGAKVIEATLLPKTTSTDSWATAANQTPTAGESARVAYNTWLRCGAPIVSGAAVTCGTSGAVLAGASSHPFWMVIDPATLVEVNSANVLTMDGGRWLTNGTANYPTTDGTHPTSAYHIILSASVSAIVNQLTALQPLHLPVNDNTSEVQVA